MMRVHLSQHYVVAVWQGLVQLKDCCGIDRQVKRFWLWGSRTLNTKLQTLNVEYLCRGISKARDYCACCLRSEICSTDYRYVFSTVCESITYDSVFCHKLAHALWLQICAYHLAPSSKICSAAHTVHKVAWLSAGVPIADFMTNVVSVSE